MKQLKSLLAALALSMSATTILQVTAITAPAVIFIGCASVWQGTVTLTATVDSASKEYARVFNQGLVSANVDAKVTQVHATYQKAAATAASALRAYKLSGDMTQYDAAFAEAMKAANEFINLIVPFITQSKSTDLKLRMLKVTSL